MDINFRQHVPQDNDPAFYLRIFIWFFGLFPPLNTVWGLIAYTTVVYIISIIIRLIVFKFGKNELEILEKEKKDFDRRLAAYRKVRSKEADKLLNEISKVYS